MQTKAFPCALAVSAIVSSQLASPLRARTLPHANPLQELGHDSSTGSWHRPGPSLKPPEVQPGLPERTSKVVAWPPRLYAARAATSLEDILQRTDLVDIAGRVEANWALVEADKPRAYDLIEAASLRHQRLAVSPSRPSEELLEIRVMHGQVAVNLYRLLQRIDPKRSASAEGRARLAAIRSTHQSHAAAAAVAMALRQLAFTDWAESPWDEDDDLDVAWTLEGIRRMGPSQSASNGRMSVAVGWAFGAMVAVGFAGLGMGRGRLGLQKPARQHEGGWVAHDVDPAPPF